MSSSAVQSVPLGRPRGRAGRPRSTKGPQGYDTHYGYLKRHCYNKRISPLLREYRFYKGRPPQRRVQEYLDFVREEYFPYLLESCDSKVMTPEVAEGSHVKTALLDLSDPKNGLPHDVANEAHRIYDFFKQRAWGGTPPRMPSKENSSTYPPSDHPIYGDHGIMHGVLPATGDMGRRTYVLDDRFSARDTKVYGHNGLAPGAWFARQLCAVFGGAHAQHLRGIAGDERRGAYSIVVSGGVYDETDRDEGDVLYYSSEGANKKDASKCADALGNRALMASRATGRLVRVLRSAKCSRHWAPPCGIRYDGLYRVVDWSERINKEGGRYKQFKLVREPGQASLEEIMRVSPTAQQQADHGHVESGY